MVSPTKQTAAELQKAYDFFNRTLFGKTLPPCLITLQRQRRSYGYFSGDRWTTEEGELTDEIALNPAHFIDRYLEETLSTLVHEMVHLWQHHFGRPGRGRYHNQEWAQQMEEIGLMPSDTGEPGGKRTGDQVSHYIVEDGPYDHAAEELVGAGFTLTWADVVSDDADDTGANKSNRTKYSCPECRINVWGKPALNLLCGDCSTTRNHVALKLS